MNPSHYQRQRSLLNPDVLRDLAIDIAGVGAVGRQVVLQLVSAGARNIRLFDHDRIEEVNVGPQGWSPADIGLTKVEAVKNELVLKYGQSEVEGIQPFFRRYPGGYPTVLFCCVDSISTRKALFTDLTPATELWLDSRVAGDTVHILAAGDQPSRDYYPESLFDPDQAFRGSCTSTMTIHLANIAAGLLIQQLSKWMRRQPSDRHTVFNLLAMESYSK